MARESHRYSTAPNSPIVRTHRLHTIPQPSALSIRPQGDLSRALHSAKEPALHCAELAARTCFISVTISVTTTPANT